MRDQKKNHYSESYHKLALCNFMQCASILSFFNFWMWVKPSLYQILYKFIVYPCQLYTDWYSNFTYLKPYNLYCFAPFLFVLIQNDDVLAFKCAIWSAKQFCIPQIIMFVYCSWYAWVLFYNYMWRLSLVRYNRCYQIFCLNLLWYISKIWPAYVSNGLSWDQK